MCSACDHPVEWHGRFGCRGWVTGGEVPGDAVRCLCGLDEVEAVRRDS